MCLLLEGGLKIHNMAYKLAVNNSPLSMFALWMRQEDASSQVSIALKRLLRSPDESQLHKRERWHLRQKRWWDTPTQAPSGGDPARAVTRLSESSLSRSLSLFKLHVIGKSVVTRQSREEQELLAHKAAAAGQSWFFWCVIDGALELNKLCGWKVKRLQAT